MRLPSPKWLSIVFLIFFLLQIPLKCVTQIWNPPMGNPVELGLVRWMRSYDKAIKRSLLEKKPIFILFQEVPGCSTCTTYGQEVMSHPLIVEAIEEKFIPLCIYNNNPGHDAQILKKFGEPSWNNPVVRIINASGKDIIPRISGNYSAYAVVEGITNSLQLLTLPVPEYLENLKRELAVDDPEELVLGMYCFWSGEKNLAGIPGVLATEAGYMGGKEVVKVRFNKEKIKARALIEKARAMQCADVVFSDRGNYPLPTKPLSGYNKDHEDKYYLYNSPYKTIPMTRYQAMLTNRALAQGSTPDHLLSKRQLAFIGQRTSAQNNIGVPILEAWRRLLN